MSTQDRKREAVFDAAYEVFSRYGFRRTSMNDLAQAAGVSRPALYLLFRNKEDLFLELVSFRHALAVAAAIEALATDGPFPERLTDAVLAYEKIFYEPIAESPHGSELMDLGHGIAAELIRQCTDRFVDLIAEALEAAVTKGEAILEALQMDARTFAELLVSSIDGIKKTSPSISLFRRRVRALASIFLEAIVVPGRAASSRPGRA